MATGNKNPPDTEGYFNIASLLTAAASYYPDLPAIILSRGTSDCLGRTSDRISLLELDLISSRYAGGLVRAGFSKSMRTLVMVRPGIEFVALIFALFKMGAVPVLIDPGMGVGRLLECVRHVRPEGLIGIGLAHLVRMFRPGSFQAIRARVSVGGGGYIGATNLEQVFRWGSDRFEMAETRGTDAAAILFTSGSTGAAKGVVYQHAMFGAQVRTIQSQYQVQPGEVDLPTFPLFTLFNPAMGVTSVIPDMNPSQPAKADPRKLVAAIDRFHITSSFGSPALWGRVADYCLARRITLPTLRRVMIAGAPVSASLVERMKRILPESGEVHTPYGATEALPVSTISGSELVRDCIDKSRRGAGNCVGRPVAGVEAAVIGITDSPIERWSNELRLAAGQCGEIVVKGPVVTREYHGQPEANCLAKIRDTTGWWHRMGDVGYLDESGRLWFCGRKAHRVETSKGVMWSIPCEAIFNNHPDVRRSALVGIGKPGTQEPVIIIEPSPGRFPTRKGRTHFVHELLELGEQFEHTLSIRRVLFHRTFPVDVRHNAKINREALARWAAKHIR